jgi:hypothetical protein
MSYLRSGHLNWDGLSVQEVAEVEEELDYYQISISRPIEDENKQGIDDWRWDESTKARTLMLGNNNKTVHSVSKNCTESVLGNQSITTFRVKLVSKKGPGVIRSGLATHSLDRVYYSYLHTDGGIIQAHHDQQNCTIRITDTQYATTYYSDVPSDEPLFPYLYFSATAGGVVDIVD